VVDTGGYLMVIVAGSFVGYIVSGHLADRLGRKRTLILFAACSFLTVIAYVYIPLSNRVMLVLGFPLGFFASGSFSPIGSFFTELFPSRSRGSGQGFSYNLGTEAGFKHIARTQPLRSELRKGAKSALPLADRAIGNLQQWLIGTCHGVSKPQLQVYLDEFVFRHNRRNTPAAAFQTLLGLGTDRKSTKYEQIRGAKDLNPNLLGLESTG
jgi:hypothetical protein